VGKALAGRDSTPAALRSYAKYLKLIDKAKKAVAIGVAVCGLSFVLCVNLCVDRDDRLGRTLIEESGLWRWGVRAFGIGVLACLVATLALVAEYLARPAPTRFALRSVLVRSLLILVAVAAVCLAMVFARGLAPGVGAAIGTVLVLAAVRERGISRAVLAIIAAVVIAWALLSTPPTRLPGGPRTGSRRSPTERYGHALCAADAP
jgi:MFS family permease